MDEKSNVVTCQICKKEVPKQEAIPAETISKGVLEIIKKDHKDWSEEGYICYNDIVHYRTEHIKEVLKNEKGELSNLEIEVIQSLKEEELLSKNINVEVVDNSTIGQRVADRVAQFGGSWTFILSFGSIIFVWILTNTVVLLNRGFDPYPFILLNLVLSCLPALQAPVIMMSQNRQEEKDRARADNDYKINLKAELEIRYLKQKMDYLTKEWVTLIEIQEMQMEILEEIKYKTYNYEESTKD